MSRVMRLLGTPRIQSLTPCQPLSRWEMRLATQETNARVRRQVKGGWLGPLSRTPRRRSNGNAESGQQVAGKQEDRFDTEPRDVDGTDG